MEYFYRVFFPSCIVDVDSYDAAISLADELGLTDCIIAPVVECLYA